MMLAFAFVCLLLPSFGLSGRSNLTIDEDMEIERQLKLLNKPAIKTIVEENGDIFDCVDINKQLAFDHPSLKDHKIQLRPSSIPEGLFDHITNGTSIEIGLKDGGCPSGSVPIKRVSKEDLIRMRSSLKHKKKMMHSPYGNLQSGLAHNYKWAAHNTPHHNPNDPEFIKYYGASALISIHAFPRLQSTQFSTGFIWIVNELVSNQVNQIQAGWTVNPSLYGDSQTRLSTAWTVDSFTNTGCQDVRCPGFVHVSKRIALGAPFSPLSTYNGPQYGIAIVIYKDPITLDWWLIYNGDEKEPVGYWPAKLVTNLANYANRVAFGGFVGNDAGSDMPPMGNGHFPSEGYGKSGFFQGLKFIDSNVKSSDVLSKDLVPLINPSKCYNVGNITQIEGRQETIFLYGGPGGSQGC